MQQEIAAYQYIHVHIAAKYVRPPIVPAPHTFQSSLERAANSKDRRSAGRAERPLVIPSMCKFTGVGRPWVGPRWILDNWLVDEQLLATPPHKVTPPGGYLPSKLTARFFPPPEKSSLAETDE